MREFKIVGCLNENDVWLWDYFDDSDTLADLLEVGLLITESLSSFTTVEVDVDDVIYMSKDFWDFWAWKYKIKLLLHL